MCDGEIIWDYGIRFNCSRGLSMYSAAVKVKYGSKSDFHVFFEYEEHVGTVRIL